MTIIYLRSFHKNYKKRVAPYPNIREKFASRLKLYLTNPTNPILKDHILRGEKEGYRAFSITGDIRLVYRKDKKALYLYDIGTHNQVY